MVVDEVRRGGGVDAGRGCSRRATPATHGDRSAQDALASTAVGTEPSDTGVHATAEYLLEAGTDARRVRDREQIGEGAMGTVFRAAHPMIGKRAAIKVLKPHCARPARDRAVRRRGARGQPDRPPEHRRHLRVRRDARRPPLLRDGAARRRDAARARARRGPMPLARWRASSARSRARSRPRTPRASSTAISSRRTCSSSTSATSPRW